MKRAIDIAAGIIFFAFAMIATIKPEHFAVPDTAERIEILTVRPIHHMLEYRFMLINQTAGTLP